MESAWIYYLSDEDVCKEYVQPLFICEQKLYGLTYEGELLIEGHEGNYACGELRALLNTVETMNHYQLSTSNVKPSWTRLL